MQTTTPRFRFRLLRQHWRGLLSVALVAMLALQTFGLVHRLDSTHHQAESLCEFCAQSNQGNAPLQPAAVLPPAPTLYIPRQEPVATFYATNRHFPPPARGPPSSNV